jgi:hypothetical protein
MDERELRGLLGQVKAGRLSTEDFLWLYDMMDELKDELTRFNKPE